MKKITYRFVVILFFLQIAPARFVMANSLNSPASPAFVIIKNAIHPGASVRIIEFSPEVGPTPEFQKKMQVLAKKMREFNFVEGIQLKDVAPDLRPDTIVGLETGNADIGFRPVSRWRVDSKAGVLTATIRPGTYRSPVQIAAIYRCPVAPGNVVKKSCRKVLSERLYAHPVPEINDSIKITAKGRLSVDFMMVNLGFADPGSNFVAYFPAIVNRLGEVVWSRFPMDGARLVPAYWNFRILTGKSAGSIALMAPRLHSYAEIFDFDDGLIHAINPAENNREILFHHDILEGPSEGTLRYLGNKRTSITNCKSLVQRMTGSRPSAGEVDPCATTPLSLIGTTIEELRFKDGSNKILWDPFRFLSFEKNPDINVEANFRIDRTIKLTDIAAALGFRGVVYRRDEFVQTDWMHGNSIEHVRGKGYLLSAKNQSKVFMISEDFKKILWSIGRDRHDSYVVAGDAVFASQHHVTMTPRGTILMFDNQVTKAGLSNQSADPSRIIELELGKNKANVVWSFTPSPLIGAPIRGSAFELENGNVLGFFPERHGKDDVILEIDRASKKPVGEIRIEHGEFFLGFRAMPVVF